MGLMTILSERIFANGVCIMKGDRILVGVLVGLGAIGLLGNGALAQSVIVPDGTLGGERSNVIENFNGATIEAIGGGARRGQNLFHSFSQFNISEGRSAYFFIPDNTVQTVLTRVTGSTPSEILGRLGTFGIVNNQFALSNAKFFFVNPNGVIFGPNSTLDIGGSVVVTTANALRFPNGELFSTTVPTLPSPVLTIDPSALLYHSINAQNSGIVVRSDSNVPNNFIGNTIGLQVRNGKSLLLVGGNVSLEGGRLKAPGGQVELAGLLRPGTIGLKGSGDRLQLEILPDSVLSNISLMPSARNPSTVYVTGSSGGDITINADNFTIVGGSVLQAGIQSGFGTEDSQAGDIKLNVTDTFHAEESSGIFNSVQIRAIGKGGNIEINAGFLNIKNGATLSSSTLGEGDAGNVSITVRDTATFDGVGNNIFSSFAGSQVISNAEGKGGTLVLNAGTLNVTNGATLSSSTFGKGDAGNVFITVRDTATFDGVGNNGFPSFAGSQVISNAESKGGTLVLNAGTLNVTNGAALSSSTLGKGDAGNVFITVRDTATFDGVGSNGFLSAAGSQVGFDAEGKGGTLTLNAGTLNVTNGAVLSSSTFGKGDAGNISITVRDTATFDGGRRNGLSSFAGSTVNQTATGKGGTLTLSAGSLLIANGAALTSSTFGKGDAGDVSITVRGVAILDGVGSNGLSSFAGSTVNRTATGKGGTLTLSAGSLLIANGAALTSSTFGKGDAGDVSITVRDVAILNGVGSNGFASLAGSFVAQNAVGAGGDLTLSARSLILSNGAKLTSSTFGRGNAGDLVIRVSDRLLLLNSSIETFSQFTSGGEIDITSKSVQLVGDSNIVTSVLSSGSGNGGNITLTANSMIAFNDSDILAFARDGKGGNVKLNTRAFFGQNYRPAPFGTDPGTLDRNDRVDINASGSLSSGTITTPDTSFIQNSLNQLPTGAIDTTKLLANTCIVRKDKPEGTFYITGTGGLPNRPGDLSPSQYPTNTITPTQTANRPWQKGDPIEEPQGFYQLANGRLVMSRECQI
jgi:filamentous hemagglutinin family protein